MNFLDIWSINSKYLKSSIPSKEDNDTSKINSLNTKCLPVYQRITQNKKSVSVIQCQKRNPTWNEKISLRQASKNGIKCQIGFIKSHKFANVLFHCVGLVKIKIWILNLVSILILENIIGLKNWCYRNVNQLNHFEVESGN